MACLKLILHLDLLDILLTVLKGKGVKITSILEATAVIRRIIAIIRILHPSI
jgi:hypothetical protein